MSDFHVPGGGAFWASADVIGPYGVPVVTAVSPASGAAGEVVIVRGSNFHPAAVVNLNSTEQATTWVNKTRVTFVVSALPILPHTLTVVSAGQTSNGTSFEVTL